MASREGGRALQPQATCDSALRGTSHWANLPHLHASAPHPHGASSATCARWLGC